MKKSIAMVMILVALVLGWLGYNQYRLSAQHNLEVQEEAKIIAEKPGDSTLKSVMEGDAALASANFRNFVLLIIGAVVLLIISAVLLARKSTSPSQQAYQPNA